MKNEEEEVGEKAGEDKKKRRMSRGEEVKEEKNV